RDRERVLDRFLGGIDITEGADQDRHGTTVLGAKHTFDLGSWNGRHRASQWLASSLNGRTSIGSVVARASFFPQANASSRSGALMIVKPPMCSLPSVNGPSIVRISPSCGRSTVALLAECSPPENTQTFADRISSRSA